MDEDLEIMMTSDLGRLERRVAYLEGATMALHILAQRPYITPEQAALVVAEADELTKDIEPLRSQRLALRIETLSAMEQTTVDELDEPGG